jgi:hypothetical protein
MSVRLWARLPRLLGRGRTDGLHPLRDPRTGSTLLCSLLAGTGVLGPPESCEVRRSKHKGVMVKVVRDADGQHVTLRCREVVWLLFDSAASPLQAPVPA